MEWSAYSPATIGKNNTEEKPPADPGEEIHQVFSFVCAIVMLVLCSIGAIGNVISIRIFTSRQMRSSINILLSGLSTVDLSVLIVSVFVYVLPGLNSYGHFGHLRPLQIVIICFLYQAGMIAQTCSVWLFVVITIERLIAVVFPLHVNRCLTVRRAKLAQVVVLVFALAYNLVRFWEYDLVYEPSEEHTKTMNESPPHWWPSRYTIALRGEYGYFMGYYTVAYILVHFAIPFPLITIFNVHILRAISEAGRQRYALMQKCRSKSDQRQQQQTTRMIVVVTAVFACCNLCPLVLNIWEAVQPSLFHDENSPIRRLIAYFLLDIANVLVTLNSAVNPFLYAVYCRQYRRICTRYFIRSLRKKRDQRASFIADGDPLTTEVDDCYYPVTPHTRLVAIGSSSPRRSKV